MSFQLILLVGPNPEQAPPLQDALETQTIVGCHQTDTLAAAKVLMSEILPDLILLFADALEAFGEDVNAFCLALRESSLDHRPTVVVLTEALQEEQRIAYLMSGADDILPSHLSIEELRVRLLVHLRRNLDTLSNRTTHLPTLVLSVKVLQRRMNQSLPWALLLIELNSLETYTEIYGQIPGDQVLRTFGAMLAALILPPDFIGQTETNRFVVLTHPDKAEKIAAMLCRQFETVTPNFYSEKDKKRGYMVSAVDERVSRRVRLLSLSIGIVTSQTHPYETYQAAFTAASEMLALAKRTPANSWVSGRLKLTGSQKSPQAENQSILVIESDAALAFLLKTTLEMQHFEVETVSHVGGAREVLASKPVHLVLIDAVIHGEEQGWTFCQEIKTEFPQTRVIFISSLHDRERALGAGADLYLPKPFELIPLFSWIDRILRDQ
jgi:DNA-binding response OmpR family regulator